MLLHWNIQNTLNILNGVFNKIVPHPKQLNSTLISPHTFKFKTQLHHSQYNKVLCHTIVPVIEVHKQTDLNMRNIKFIDWTDVIQKHRIGPAQFIE